MGRIEDYRVVQSSSSATLTEEVRRLMSNGWEPLGGVSFSGDMTTWVQAIVWRRPTLRSSVEQLS